MDNLIVLLETYKYLMLIPLAIIEGPIISVIAGFLVTMNIFNPWIVYLIIIMGDLVGDTMYYSIGRFGQKMLLKRFEKFFGITEKKYNEAKEFFNIHRIKTVVLSKIIHGVGFTGLIVAGSMKVSYVKYILLCLITTLFQAALFLIIGILFGHAYVQIGKYLDYFAASTVIIAFFVLLFFVVKKYRFNSKLS